MTDSIRRNALFVGLVYNEAGQPADIAYVGGEPHYVILDEDFRRHVASEHVDRQVLKWLQEMISANQDMVTQGAMNLLGQDDLFTKAAIDSSIKNIEDLIEHGLPDDARTWLGMFGFRITVDVHGDVIEIYTPTQDSDE
jgi:hypothetical protein